MASGLFEREEATTVIRASGLPRVIIDRVPDTLGPIFYDRANINHTWLHWKVTMAMDRYLTVLNRAEFSALGGLENEQADMGDNDMFDDPYTVYQVAELIKHIQRHEGAPMPVLTTTCGARDMGAEGKVGARCRVWSICMPYEGEGDFTPHQAQHSCVVAHNSKERSLVNGNMAICNILDFPAPLARRYWYHARRTEHDGSTETPEAAASGSHLLLLWNVNRGIGERVARERRAGQKVHTQ